MVKSTDGAVPTSKIMLGSTAPDDRSERYRVVVGSAPSWSGPQGSWEGTIRASVIPSLGYGSTSPDVLGLNRDLETLRSKVDELKSQVVTNDQFSQLSTKSQ